MLGRVIGSRPGKHSELGDEGCDGRCENREQVQGESGGQRNTSPISPASALTTSRSAVIASTSHSDPHPSRCRPRWTPLSPNLPQLAADMPCPATARRPHGCSPAGSRDSQSVPTGSANASAPAASAQPPSASSRPNFPPPSSPNSRHPHPSRRPIATSRSRWLGHLRRRSKPPHFTATSDPRTRTADTPRRLKTVTFRHRPTRSGSEPYVVATVSRQRSRPTRPGP